MAAGAQALVSSKAGRAAKVGRGWSIPWQGGRVKQGPETRPAGNGMVSRHPEKRPQHLHLQQPAFSTQWPGTNPAAVACPFACFADGASVPSAAAHPALSSAGAAAATEACAGRGGGAPRRPDSSRGAGADKVQALRVARGPAAVRWVTRCIGAGARCNEGRKQRAGGFFSLVANSGLCARGATAAGAV